MLKRSDIKNMNYDNDKRLIEFEVQIPIEGSNGSQVNKRFWFERLPEDEVENPRDKMYEVYTNIGEQVYKMCYEMPKANMDLVLIAATGLNQLRLMLQEEFMYKQMVAISIGEEIRNML